MKLVANIGKAFGAFVLLIALMAFITGASLFVVGAFLTTWPVLRLSPRGRKKAAIAQATVAAFGVLQAFQPNTDDDDA